MRPNHRSAASSDAGCFSPMAVRIAIALICMPLFGTFANQPSPFSQHPQRRQTFPQAYAVQGDTTENLFIATAFKTRNSRFIRELADSVRRVAAALADTAGSKYLVFSLRIDRSGKVVSASVQCPPDTACGAIGTRVGNRLLSWQFRFSPQQDLRIVQDIGVPRKSADNFFTKNKVKIWVGIGLLAALLIFL